MCRFERWNFGDGKRRRVAVRRRQPCGDDVCPDCGRAIAVAIADTPDLGQAFRLECLSCRWTTDALPDPKREDRPFKRFRPHVKGFSMHTNHHANTPETPFKHRVSGEDGGDPAAANDFDDIEAQRRHVLPVGKAVIFDDFYRSRVMYIGAVEVPDEGKPVYYLFADPEALRGNGVADYFLDAALSMTTDIFRAPPEEQAYGFYLAPAHLDKPEDKARSDYRLVESIYNKFELKHAARAKREAVYKCHRCKRQSHKRHPDDHELLYYCSVPDHLRVNAANPEECRYFWFDRWYGSPPDVK